MVNPTKGVKKSYLSANKTDQCYDLHKKVKMLEQ